jgi:hypothetical protein
VKLHGFLLLACLTPVLSATPMFGVLNYTGDLRVSTTGTVTTIDFLPGVVINGDVSASNFSNSGAFSAFNGLTAAQRAGTTVDISSNSSFPILGFLDFNNTGVFTLDSMVINLLSLVTSTAPVGCPLVMAINESCQPIAGSVFTLTRDSTGTTARVSGGVLVTQGGDTLMGILNLSAQFNQTPAEVAGFGSTTVGTPDTTFSATISTVPEPGTYLFALLGLGGMLVGRAFRKS